MSTSNLNELSYHPLLKRAKSMEETINNTKDNQTALVWALFIVASVGFAF